MILAGDVGGTKTDLAVFTPAAGPRAPLARKRFRSADYPSLEAIAVEFLRDVGLPVRHARFAVAGPVSDGSAYLTNLDWTVDETTLRLALGLESVGVLNDLEAIAAAVPLLVPSDLHVLRRGAAVAGGAIAVIAPGTGLGEAFLTWDGARYRAHPSEGGHADFAPTTDRELDLLRYFRRRVDHVSYERVCSGPGIASLYEFLRDDGYASESQPLARRLAASADRTPAIVAAALDPRAPDPLAAGALSLFVSILGSEAGNLALKVLATGGVYLTGGVPPRILPLLAQDDFLAAFERKGRLSGLLSRVPVHVILEPVGLLGAASLALDYRPETAQIGARNDRG